MSKHRLNPLVCAGVRQTSPLSAALSPLMRTAKCCESKPLVWTPHPWRKWTPLSTTTTSPVWPVYLGDTLASHPTVQGSQRTTRLRPKKTVTSRDHRHSGHDRACRGIAPPSDGDEELVSVLWPELVVRVSPATAMLANLASATKLWTKLVRVNTFVRDSNPPPPLSHPVSIFRFCQRGRGDRRR